MTRLCELGCERVSGFNVEETLGELASVALNSTLKRRLGGLSYEKRGCGLIGFGMHGLREV